MIESQNSETNTLAQTLLKNGIARTELDAKRLAADMLTGTKKQDESFRQPIKPAANIQDIAQKEQHIEQLHTQIQELETQLQHKNRKIEELDAQLQQLQQTQISSQPIETNEEVAQDIPIGQLVSEPVPKEQTQQPAQDTSRLNEPTPEMLYKINPAQNPRPESVERDYVQIETPQEQPAAESHDYPEIKIEENNDVFQINTQPEVAQSDVEQTPEQANTVTEIKSEDQFITQDAPKNTLSEEEKEMTDLTNLFNVNK